jgi:hypothetical protein
MAIAPVGPPALTLAAVSRDLSSYQSGHSILPYPADLNRLSKCE